MSTFALGDDLTRTSMRQTTDPVTQQVVTVLVTETVTLPAIDVRHLTEVTVGAAVEGFHVLPASTPPITSTSLVVVNGVTVRDGAGVEIVGATVKILPHRVPAGTADMIEAAVEVFDVAGRSLGKKPLTTLFPPAWTLVRIERAIYDAYAMHFDGGGAVTGKRLHCTTSQGVRLVLRVNGQTTSSGTKLQAIPLACLVPGQSLDSTHLPK